MSRNWIVLFLLSVVIQLVGCGSNVKPQPPAPIVEQSVPAIIPEATAPETSREPVIVSPVAPQIQAPVIALNRNAVTSLITQARAQYQTKNYQAAVATAERGLRIDRRSPELYLILAQSYVHLANAQLAQQFVQQGLRYAQAGTDVAQKLLTLRESFLQQ